MARHGVNDFFSERFHAHQRQIYVQPSMSIVVKLTFVEQPASQNSLVYVSKIYKEIEKNHVTFTLLRIT